MVTHPLLRLYLPLDLLKKEDENLYGCRIRSGRGGLFPTSDFDYVQLVVKGEQLTTVKIFYQIGRKRT